MWLPLGTLAALPEDWEPIRYTSEKESVVINDSRYTYGHKNMRDIIRKEVNKM